MKKRLGQHFLYNQTLLRKIVDVIQPAGKVLVEIGGGKGTLTEFLTDARELYIIEIDRQLYDELKNRFEKLDHVKVVCGDILDFDFNLVGSNSITVCGNIPYYITTAIMEKIVENRAQIHEAVLLMQKEYAERLVATPGMKAYSSITVFVNLFYDVKKVFNVSGGAFLPPAKVKSSLVLLRRHYIDWELDDIEQFSRFVRKLFSFRRKKIKNALIQAGYTPVSSRFEDRRIEQLSIKDMIELFKQVVG